MKRARIILLGMIVFFIALSYSIPINTIPRPTSDVVDISPSLEEVPSLAGVTTEYSYVSGAVDHPTWPDPMGFVDGKAYGEAGFSVANLQSDNGVNSVFTEAVVFPSCRFSYVFEIDTSLYSSYLFAYIEFQGYCQDSLDPISISWSSTLSGTYTDLTTISQTNQQTRSYGVSITTNTIYVYFSDTDVNMGEPASTYYFDYLRVRFTDPPPENLWVETDTFYDTDNFYPGRGTGTSDTYYLIEAVSEDKNGGSAITNHRLRCKTEGGTTLWTVTWDNSGGFSEDDSADRIELISASSSSTVDGDRRRTLFAVEIMFDHDPFTDLDWEVYCYTSTATDTDTFDRMYDNGGILRDVDVITSLEWVNTPVLSQTSRCNPGASLGFAGSVKFAGSGGNVYPLTCYAAVSRTSPSGWSTTQSLSSGAFDVIVPTSGSAGDDNTFSVTIKESDTDKNILGPSTDSVKLDTVVAYEFGAVDSWINYDSTTTVYTKLRYYSDTGATSPITSGTVYLNGNQMSYQNGRWEYTSPSQSSPTTVTYDSLSSVSTPEGVTQVSTHPSISVTYDRVRVNSMNAYRVSDDIEDYVIAVDGGFYVQIQLQYEENGGYVTDGAVSVNGYSFSYTGSNGIWQSNDLFRTEVMSLTFDSVIFTSNPSSGVSLINQNSQTRDIVWTALMVELSLDDGHVSPNTNIRIWAHVTRAYDGSEINDMSSSVILRISGDGTNYPMTPTGSSGLWYLDRSEASIAELTLYVYSISDSIYGITQLGQGGFFDGSTAYVNCGYDSSLDLTTSLSIALWFKPTGSGGTSMQIVSKGYANNAQYALFIDDTNALRFTYHDASQIRSVLLRSSITFNQWHHIMVAISGTTLNFWFDGSHVIDDATLDAALVSKASEPVYIGAAKSGASQVEFFQGFVSEIFIYSMTLTDVQCEEIFQGSYPSSNLVLHLERSSIDISADTWVDLSPSLNDGIMNGITVVLGTLPSNNDERVLPIWTQVRVSSYSTDDPVIDTGDQASCHVVLVYTHGGIVEDGTISINGVSASYSGSIGEWDFGPQEYSAGSVLYDTVSFSGGAYGLTGVDQNSQTLTQVWAEIIILTTTIVDPDGVHNLGTQAEIRVTAQLSYLGHVLGSGDTLIMNGIAMQYHPTAQYFYYRPTQNDVGTWSYYVNDSISNNEDTYGISAVNIDGHIVEATWTGLIIDITDPSSQMVNLGANASGIYYSVVYAHNLAPYDGTIEMNNTVFLYSTAGKRGYALETLTGDDSLGISYIITDDETYCIWNGYIITLTDPSPQTVLVGRNASGIIVSAISAYDGQPFDGTITLNDTTFEYHTEGKRGYTVLSLSGGSLGISAIALNDVTYAIWVRDSVEMERFQYGYRDTYSVHGTWVADGNTTYSLTGLTLSMTNSPVGLLEAAWAGTDFGTAPVTVLRYPVFFLDYQFSPTNVHIQAAINITYRVDLTVYSLLLPLESGSNILEINLKEYGLPVSAQVIGLEMMVYEALASAESGTSSLRIDEASLRDSIVTWSHDYRLDVWLVADGGTSTEGVTVNFYLYEDSAWTLIGSNTTRSDGWACYYINSRGEVPGTQWEFMVTWNATDAGPYLSGEVAYGVERDYVDIVPIKVFASDIIITSVQDPIEYKEPLVASVVVTDQDGNPINSTLGFAYRLECPELGTTGSLGWGYWDGADWHSLGIVDYPAGQNLTLVVAFQSSSYYELIGSPQEIVPIIKRLISSSTLSPYISYYIHTQLGDTPAIATLEYSDAFKVVIVIFDSRRTEIVTEIVNVTYTYQGQTYWALTSGGTASLTFPDADVVGIMVTATLSGFLSQNYTLNDDLTQSRSISVVKETLSFMEVTSEDLVGVDYDMPIYVTAYDNDNEGILGTLEISVNGTDTFYVIANGATFTVYHFLSMEGDITVQGLANTTNYNMFTSSEFELISTGLQLIIEDISNGVPLYESVIVNVTMRYTYDNALVEEGFFTLNGSIYHIQDSYCITSYFASLLPGVYTGVFIPLNDSSTVFASGPEFYHDLNWTPCYMELNIILEDAYALDLVEVVFYLFNTNESILVPAAGFEVDVVVYYASGTLASGIAVTNTSGYAVFTFNLTLFKGTPFTVNGTFDPEPPLNPSEAQDSALTLARPMSDPDVVLDTPKGQQTGYDISWFFTDEGNFTILIRDYAGTVVTIPVHGELYSGGTLLWSDTQTGHFELSMVNVWGANSSALDTFHLRFTITSDYHDTSWSFTLDVDLVMEVAVILPLEDPAEILLAGDLILQAFFLDIDADFLPGNTTDIASSITSVPASLYCYLGGSWQLVANDLLLVDGSATYDWDWDDLPLEAGVYTFEWRYGGPGTGVMATTSEFTVIVGKEPSSLTGLTQSLTVVYGTTVSDCVSVYLSTSSPLADKDVELWAIVGTQHRLLATATTNGMGLARFEYDPLIYDLPAGVYRIYASYDGNDTIDESLSSQIWFTVAKETLLITLPSAPIANFSLPATFSCLLEGTHLGPLGGMEVALSYDNGTHWVELMSSMTNSTGHATFTFDTSSMGIDTVDLRISVDGGLNYVDETYDLVLTISPTFLSCLSTELRINGEPVELVDTLALLDGDVMSLSTCVVDALGTPVAHTWLTLLFGEESIAVQSDEDGMVVTTFELTANATQEMTISLICDEEGYTGTDLELSITLYAGVQISIAAPRVMVEGYEAEVLVRTTNADGVAMSSTVEFLGATYQSVGGQVLFTLDPAPGAHRYTVFVIVGGQRIPRPLYVECVSLSMDLRPPTTLYPNQTALYTVLASLTPHNCSFESLSVFFVTSIDGVVVANTSTTISEDAGSIAAPRWSAPVTNGSHVVLTQILYSGWAILQETSALHVYSVYATIEGPTFLPRGYDGDFLVRVFRDNMTLSGSFKERILADGVQVYDGSTVSLYTVNRQFITDGAHNITVILTVHGVQTRYVHLVTVEGSSEPAMGTIGLVAGGSAITLMGVALALRRRGSGVDIPKPPTPPSSSGPPDTPTPEDTGEGPGFYEKALESLEWKEPDDE